MRSGELVDASCIAAFSLYLASIVNPSDENGPAH